MSISLSKLELLRGLLNPDFFKKEVRPKLYKMFDNDPEKVHDGVLRILNQNTWALKFLRPLFNAPDELKIKLNGRDIVPFGTAAGLDKNGDALMPLSYLFGFQEPGTVVVTPREGNPQPRVYADEQEEDVYNAQGFPSKGLLHFYDRISAYRRARKQVPIFVSVCGLPLSEKDAKGVAMREYTRLVTELDPYVEGFVFNPFSPNTDALKLLRTPQIFKETAELTKELAPRKIYLVKEGPYEDDDGERRQIFSLAEAWVQGGGHGFVIPNTKMFPKEKIPVSKWGYPVGGRSGRFLQPYRFRSVIEHRRAFPDSVIVATGGIFDGDDAYVTFKAGATMLEGYTPYIFYGPGLLRRIQKRVVETLKQDGYRNLEDLQESVRRNPSIQAHSYN